MTTAAGRYRTPAAAENPGSLRPSATTTGKYARQR